MRRALGGLIAVAAGLAIAGTVVAQGSPLDRRVTAVANGTAELHFEARADVCGNGVNWYRVGSDSWYGTYYSNGGGDGRDACDTGPVRVLVTVVDREIVRLRTFVGPLGREASATDLGPVPSREAAEWLVALGQRLDGRAAREALGAAVLAKEGVSAAAVQAIAADEDRPRETRRSALSALARVEGVTALIALAEQRSDSWLATEATRVLGRSSDPRARAALRGILADDARSQETLAAAVAAIGNDQASGADAKLLRERYRSIEAPKAKEAVLSALANVGGTANIEWLTALAGDATQSLDLRRRAVSLMERAGASGEELVALFDRVNDTETRGAVISALAQEGSRPSREKLVAIAKSTEVTTTRRRAISALERFDSPDVRQALTTLAMPRP